MATVGLVLGGGGITGASYHLGTLLALEMATGWHPSQADVIIGTSCGAFTAAMVRGGQLSIDAFLDEAHSRDEVARRLRARVYRRSTRPKGVVRWLRRGVLPGLTRPDLRLVAGSPALYTTEGIVDWVEERLGPLADAWPAEPTVICAFDLAKRRRAPFGTDAAPSVGLKYAVAASVAVPMVFEPVQIEGRWYADGGIATGTSADLLLGSPEQLDLVIVVAPMAASESREGARFYEDAFDRAGRAALSSGARPYSSRLAWNRRRRLPARRAGACGRPAPTRCRPRLPCLPFCARSGRSRTSSRGLTPGRSCAVISSRPMSEETDAGRMRRPAPGNAAGLYVLYGLSVEMAGASRSGGASLCRGNGRRRMDVGERVLAWLHSLPASERGASLVEYAFLAILIAMAALIAAAVHGPGGQRQSRGLQYRVWQPPQCSSRRMSHASARRAAEAISLRPVPPPG